LLAVTLRVKNVSVYKKALAFGGEGLCPVDLSSLDSENAVA